MKVGVIVSGIEGQVETRRIDRLRDALAREVQRPRPEAPAAPPPRTR